MSRATIFHRRFSSVAFPASFFSSHSFDFFSALFEMNPMKRLLFFVSLAALSLSFAACKSASNSESANTSQPAATPAAERSEEHTSELQSRSDLVCRLLLEKKKKKLRTTRTNHTRHNTLAHNT